MPLFVCHLLRLYYTSLYTLVTPFDCFFCYAAGFIVLRSLCFCKEYHCIGTTSTSVLMFWANKSLSLFISSLTWLLITVKDKTNLKYLILKESYLKINQSTKELTEWSRLQIVKSKWVFERFNEFHVPFSHTKCCVVKSYISYLTITDKKRNAFVN